MRLELSDLPAWARAQAEKQIAARQVKKNQNPVEAAAKAAKASGRDFDSLGEWEFYIGTIAPKIASGEIVKCEQHPRFVLFPEGEYNGLKLRAIRYTADFRLDYADGTVEVVEIKSKFVRRMQRDYHIRRRIFLEQVRPLGWKFREVITCDSKDEQVQWEKLKRG